MIREFELLKAHVEYADHTALARLEDADRNSRGYVGHVEGDDRLWSYVRGARAEMAFYLWLGGKESGAKWNTFWHDATAMQLLGADIEHKGYRIDVKSRPERWTKGNIVRRQSLNPDHAYVLTINKHPKYLFYGWMWGHEIAKCPIGGRDEVPGHEIPDDHELIKDCRDLKDGQRLDVLLEARAAIAAWKQFEFISGEAITSWRGM